MQLNFWFWIIIYIIVVCSHIFRIDKLLIHFNSVIFWYYIMSFVCASIWLFSILKIFWYFHNLASDLNLFRAKRTIVLYFSPEQWTMKLCVFICTIVFPLLLMFKKETIYIYICMLIVILIIFTFFLLCIGTPFSSSLKLLSLPYLPH